MSADPVAAQPDREDRIVEVADGEARAFEGGYSDWFERSRADVVAS